MAEGEVYTNDPHDDGGPTKYGITQVVLQRWYKDQVVTPVDVQNLTRETASNIYLKFYWEANRLNELKNPDMAKLLFDQIVNSGARSIAELTQQVLIKMNFKVTVDGVFGPETIKTLNLVNFRVFGVNFIKQRQIFYIKITKRKPDQLRFLEGWINRTHTLLDQILKGAL